MTAGLPNISYENGFINPLCRDVGHVSSDSLGMRG